MGFFSKLGDLFSEEWSAENSNTENERENPIVAEENTEDERITLASEFVAEIEKYYLNDVLKQKSDYITVANLSESQLKFLKKKIEQDEETAEEISALKNQLFEIERELTAVWGKSSYSFYDQLEEKKKKEVYEKLYQTALTLIAINVKEELETIIIDRFEKLKRNWNIRDGIPIPKSSKIKLIECDEESETYKFGSFVKKVQSSALKKSLLSIHKSMIANLKLQLHDKFSNENKLWIRMIGLSRLDVEFIRKTKLLKNDWEYDSKFSFDVVDKNDLEPYIKGCMELLYQTECEYILFWVLSPLQIGEIVIEENKVLISNIPDFIWKERQGFFENYSGYALVKKRSFLENLIIEEN